MTKEKLEIGNRLIKEISICKDQIEWFQYTQHENVIERPIILSHNGTMDNGIIPSHMWQSLGKILLNEWQIKLIELQNQFDEL